MGIWTKGGSIGRMAILGKKQKWHEEKYERGGCNNPPPLPERGLKRNSTLRARPFGLEETGSGGTVIYMNCHNPEKIKKKIVSI